MTTDDIKQAVQQLLDEETASHEIAWDYMMEAHNRIFNSSDIDGVEVWVKECRKRELDVSTSLSKMMVLKRVLKLFN